MGGFPFEERNVVLVTGSNGMLGRHVQAEIDRVVAIGQGWEIQKGISPRQVETYDESVRRIIECGTSSSPGELQRQDRRTTQWGFVTRQDADLRDNKAVQQLFKKFQPTHVLHLAASLQ